jgi:hypothetical protein
VRLQEVGQVREGVSERRQLPVENANHARFGRVEDLSRREESEVSPASEGRGACRHHGEDGNFARGRVSVRVLGLTMLSILKSP